MKKMLSPVLALLAFAVCLPAALAKDETSPLAKVEGAPDLEKASKAKFRETYVKVDADFQRYNKLYLGDAFFDYRDVGDAPRRYRSSMYGTSHKSFFGISEEDRRKFEEIADEAFIKELGKAKNFEITETLDENTILMRGAVVDIVSRVPPEFSGRSEVYLASSGEATLVLEFLDGTSGEVLARVAERRAFGNPSRQIDIMTMPTNSVTVWADVRRWASQSARRLRTELDLAMEGR